MRWRDLFITAPWGSLSTTYTIQSTLSLTDSRLKSPRGPNTIRKKHHSRTVRNRFDPVRKIIMFCSGTLWTMDLGYPSVDL
jgi:hypothetical protein